MSTPHYSECQVSQRRLQILLESDGDNLHLLISRVYHIRRGTHRATHQIQEQVQCIFLGLVALSLFVFNYFPFLFFSSIGW